MQNLVLSSPVKKGPRAKPKRKDLSDTSKMEARNTAYDIYKGRKHVTLKTSEDGLQTKEIITLSRQSLASLFKDIGFKFRKEDNRRALIERYYVRLMEIVFLNETWIYSNGSKGKSWQDDSVKSVRKPEDYDGKRLMVFHTGTENRFIGDGNLTFASNNKAAGYDASMNSRKFEQWG
ncbi:hypothetical protein Trydic_g11517 [Trypoxylus dichotomus]